MGKKAKPTAVSTLLDKASLLGQRQRAENAFDALTQELQKRVNNHNEFVEATKTELSRLQGEYRLLNQLLGEDKK